MLEIQSLSVTTDQNSEREVQTNVSLFLRADPFLVGYRSWAVHDDIYVFLILYSARTEAFNS